MKKLVSLVLALCMLLSVVAVASAEEKVVINVWRKTFNLAQPDQEQVKKVQDAINAIEQMLAQKAVALCIDVRGNPGGYKTLMSKNALPHGCPACGGECYAPSLTCFRCERRGSCDSDRTEPGL